MENFSSLPIDKHIFWGRNPALKHLFRTSVLISRISIL
jgi:hypothetical protein